MFFIVIIAYFFYGLQPNVSRAEPEELKIEKGEGIREIGARLSQRSLIKSVSVFKFYSLMSGKAQKFQPGVYDLKASMSVPQIVNVLTRGEVKQVRVIVTEGMTLKDVDTLLADAGVIKEGTLTAVEPADLAADFLFLPGVSLLEGFLFPDTYNFRVDSSAEEIAERFLINFRDKVWPLLEGAPAWYDRLILASFLEREVPGFPDRQIVAGILLKRLEVKMPLQVDATITYAKCDGKVRSCPSPLIRQSDLTIVSPYNTYQRLGLTPTPIANPGQTAIRAALSPVQSPYWYYLSALETKETIFSETLDEHNFNRVKYL